MIEVVFAFFSVWQNAVAVSLIILTAFCVFLTLFNLLRKNSRLLTQLQQASFALSSIDSPWIYWTRNNPTFIFSKHFKVLSEGRPMNLQIFQAKFPQFHMREFLLKLQKSPSYAEETVATSGESFLVTGVIRPTKTDTFFMLNLKNITPSKSKISHQEDTIQNLESQIQLLNNVLDALPWPVWHKDKEKKFVYCNKAYASILDTTQEKVLRDQLELYGKSSRSFSTDKTSGEKTYVIWKGARVCIEVFETTIRNASIVGYANNINEQENLKEEIKRLSQSTHEILTLISLPIIIFNQSRKIEFYNVALLRMFDLDQNWMESAPTLTEVLEQLRSQRKLPETEDFQSIKKRADAAFNNLIEAVEEVIYFPNGKTVRLVVAPYHNGGLMITLNDISDWLTLEQQYNTLLAVHRQVADHLFEGMAVFGTDNRLRLYNSAFSNMWQYKEKELEDMPHLDQVIETLHDQIDVEHYATTWKDFKKRILEKVEDRAHSKDGRIKLLNDVIYDYAYTPLPDGASLLTFLDVSDRYRVEKILLERGAVLELAHQAKAEFISTIHLGIKDPLRRILTSFSDILKQKFGALNLEYYDKIKLIWEDIEHILEFIENANSLAFLETGKLKLNKSIFSLATMLEGVIHSLKKSYEEKNIVYEVYDETEENSTIGDVAYIKQAFINLIRNIVIFAKQGQVIHLFLLEVDQKINIRIRIDSQIPFDDAYKSSKKLKKGEIFTTGLGFSLTQKILELHDAEIELSYSDGTEIICVFNKISQADSFEEQEVLVDLDAELVPIKKTNPSKSSSKKKEEQKLLPFSNHSDESVN